METPEWYGKVSLGYGIAALALVWFWFLEFWGGLGVFGVPYPWDGWLMLGVPALFMLLGGAALLLGREAHRAAQANEQAAPSGETGESPMDTPQGDDAAAVAGTTFGFVAVLVGTLLVLLAVVFVVRLASMDS